MKQGLSRNPGGGKANGHPALIKGKGTTMAAKKKNTAGSTAAKKKNPASHNPRVPAGYHLAKNRKSGGHSRHHSRNPFNMSGDVVKVAVGVIAAIGVNYAAQMVPIDQSNPIVRGAVKAAIGVAGSVVLASKPAIAEGVLMGCGIAGGLDIASGILPGLSGGGARQQMLIQVPQNPSQQAAGSPGGLTATTSKTVGAIRRQLSGNMRGIRMVTGNPAMFAPYQYAA